MTYLHLSAVFGLVLFAACFYGATAKKKSSQKLPVALPIAAFALAFIARLICAYNFEGFDTDNSCFAAWADRMYQLGPGQFYSPDVFTDYPPGYMYISWILGWLKNLFKIPYLSSTHIVLLRLPSIISDMVIAYLLYREGSKRLPERTAFFITLAFLFNPTVYINSSVWGQVDSILTLAVVGMCLCLMKGKMLPSYIIFGLGVLFKPQMLLFGPILIIGIIDQVFLNGFTPKKFWTNLTQGLSAIAGMVVLMLPFGFMNVWNQYFGTLESYEYAAVNACNFWGMLGLNWVDQTNTFLGISYKTYGTLFIILFVALIGYLGIRIQKWQAKYFMLSALLIVSIFMFSVRMHERYMYPAIGLLLFASLYTDDIKEAFLGCGAFSFFHFYNTAWVLFFYGKADYDRKSLLWILPSIGTLAILVLLYVYTFRLLPKQTNKMKRSTMKPTKLSAIMEQPTPSEKKEKLNKIDYIWMVAITLIYSVFALMNLGDMHAPETVYEIPQKQMVDGVETTVDNKVMEFYFDEQSPTNLHYYIAPWHDRKMTMDYQAQDGAWYTHGEITLGSVFTWQNHSLPADAKAIRLTLNEADASLLEFVFVDGANNIITPVNASDYPELFDEQEEFPEVSTFRNSMYFDEIYHGRTAYEFLEGRYSYENTHPPLGKVFISIGVAIFGMNPFGWRIMGTLFGIFMLPFIYLFARKLTKNTSLAALACTIFAFDFMHFTQSRISTIDVYVTFFVILMYYFMYQYTTMSFYDTPLKKTFVPLALSGVCMGLGVASKWTGAYAGMGLAVIFFATLYKRYTEYKYARRLPRISTNGISHRYIIDNFKPHVISTIKFCLIAFVAVPLVIYTLSYLPFNDYSNDTVFFRMLKNQETMLSYHSGLNATHPYSSAWHEWPTIGRPMWYYSRIVTGAWGAGGLREGISAFGNPAVWWVGIPAAIFMVYLFIRRKDKIAGFLLVGYLAQYLPWFFVTRITFIYHYFPSVVFVVLMIIYSIMQLKKLVPTWLFNTILIVYGAITVGLFLLFYPVLSGAPIEAEFVDKYLRWFSDWVLTAT